AHQSDDVWAAGGAGALLHYGGLYWSRAHRATTDEPVRALWGVDASNVWAVGGATLLRYGGTGWAADTSLRAPFGVTFGAAAGTLLHCDGVGWSPVTTGVTASLTSVWGSAAGDVWVVGAGGTILHDDGTSATTVTSPVSVDLAGVWVSSAGDAWAVGAVGNV